MAIAIAYAMGIPKFICFNDMFVCRKCAARLCAFSNHLIQRSHIMRIGKNPQGSGSKHSRRKRSECDFLLGFHCISSMKTFARPGVYPQNAKVVPAACLPSVAFSRTKSCSHVELPRSLHRFFPIICRNHIVYPPSALSGVGYVDCFWSQYTISYLSCQPNLTKFLHFAAFQKLQSFYLYKTPLATNVTIVHPPSLSTSAYVLAPCRKNAPFRGFCPLQFGEKLAILLT